MTGLSRFPDKRVDRQHESRAKASYSFSEPHSLLSVRRRRVLIMHLVRTPFARRSGQKERYRVLERHTTAPIPRTRQHVGRKLILAQAYRGAKKSTAWNLTTHYGPSFSPQRAAAKIRMDSRPKDRHSATSHLDAYTSNRKCTAAGYWKGPRGSLSRRHGDQSRVHSRSFSLPLALPTQTSVLFTCFCLGHTGVAK